MQIEQIIDYEEGYNLFKCNPNNPVLLAFQNPENQYGKDVDFIIVKDTVEPLDVKAVLLVKNEVLISHYIHNGLEDEVMVLYEDFMKRLF